MRKHLVYCLSASCLMFSVASNAQVSDGDGLYAGVQLDRSWQNIDGHSNQLFFNGSIGAFSNLGATSFSNDQNLLSGKVFVGQNYFNDDFVLGAELGASWYQNTKETIHIRNATVDLTVSEYVTKISPNYMLSFSLLPGVQVDSVTFYGRIGAGMSHYNIFENSVIDTEVSPEVYSIGKNADIWSPEVILGLGIKKKFSNNLAVRLEYNYTKSKSFSVPFNVARSTAVTSVVRALDNNYSFSSNSLGLGLIYECDGPETVFTK
ncbi:MAG: outer membrane beta-barrel protein [Legionella sp.]|nr:outer membrane beta-barrel protein [Legionella sp.]